MGRWRKRPKLHRTPELHQWYRQTHNYPRLYWCPNCNAWGDDLVPVYIITIHCLECGGVVHRGGKEFVERLMDQSNSLTLNDTRDDDIIPARRIGIMVNTQEIKEKPDKHIFQSKTFWFNSAVLLVSAILALPQLQAIVDVLPGQWPSIAGAIVTAVNLYLRSITVKPIRLKRLP